MTIVEDSAIRSGEPRIEGTRITVLDVKRRVVDSDDDPAVVAGEYDISLADLHSALSYYYNHRDQYTDRETASQRERIEGEHQTRALFGTAGDEDTGQEALEQPD